MLENLKCDKMPDLPKRCMKLLDKDPSQLERELAYIVIETIEHWTPQTPPEKPSDLFQYERLSPIDKVKFNKDHPDWQEMSGIKEWIRKRDMCINENKSHIHWLKRFATLLENDPTAQEILLSKLDEMSGLESLEAKKVAKKFHHSGRRDWFGEENE